jgi:hypothetical protein
VGHPYKFTALRATIGGSPYYCDLVGDGLLYGFLFNFLVKAIAVGAVRLLRLGQDQRGLERFHFVAKSLDFVIGQTGKTAKRRCYARGGAL